MHIYYTYSIFIVKTNSYYPWMDGFEHLIVFPIFRCVGLLSAWRKKSGRRCRNHRAVKQSHTHLLWRGWLLAYPSPKNISTHTYIPFELLYSVECTTVAQGHCNRKSCTIFLLLFGVALPCIRMYIFKHHLPPLLLYISASNCILVCAACNNMRKGRIRRKM